jgi:hypothetical protein
VSEREPTCEQRIDEQLAGRMDDLEAVDRILSASSVTHVPVNAIKTLTDSFGYDIEFDGDDPDVTMDQLRDKAEQALQELPLGATKQVVWRVDLSTGGPGDWFEFYVDDNGDVERIEYHFNDWFDHAQRSISHDTDRWNALETAFRYWVGES